MEQDIYRLKKDQPHLSAVEIRHQLIKHGICAKKSAPSVPSINRFFKTKGFKRGLHLDETEPVVSSSWGILNDTTQLTAGMDLKPPTPFSAGSSTKLKYSIDSILNFGELTQKFF